MAHLWHRRNDDGWTFAELHSAAALRGDMIEPLERFDAHAFTAPALLHPPLEGDPLGAWLLLARRDSGVQVNGEPLTSAIRVLRDRDAIRLPGCGPMYFSAERRARIEPFPDIPDAHCPRCRLPLEPGEGAVRCPCGVWYHQRAATDGDEGQPCWTYADTCALCGHPTSLEAAAFRWTPEEL